MSEIVVAVFKRRQRLPEMMPALHQLGVAEEDISVVKPPGLTSVHRGVALGVVIGGALGWVSGNKFHSPFALALTGATIGATLGMYVDLKFGVGTISGEGRGQGPVGGAVTMAVRTDHGAEVRRLLRRFGAHSLN